MAPIVSSRIILYRSSKKIMESSDKDQGGKKITGVKTFSVPFALGEIKENITVNTNTPSKPSKEEIINQAFKFHSKGNISEAAKYYQLFINQGLKDQRVFSNYGVILKDLGKLKEAELSYRKGIEIKPDYANAHLNLGNILKDQGKLQDAELSYRKAIELKHDFAEAHFNLGIILEDLGKLDQALLCFEAAIDINKNLEIALEEIGKVLLKIGNHSDGILKLREAVGSIGFNHKKSSITIN
ncbi:tetratricopeptide repeat protein [Prochlorococcus sp. MIT 0916]|uniref:tetratricopeptide repeat protein n=1 Tax=Prochlorococcus sp. MIT 0916 TaxID=3082521 RepID=UPI0039B36E74